MADELFGLQRARNDLSRETVMKFHHGLAKFMFNGIGFEHAGFMSRVLEQSFRDKSGPPEAFEDSEQEWLAARIYTSLQFANHSNLVFSGPCRKTINQVTRDNTEETIVAAFGVLDARPARIGYFPKTLTDVAVSLPSEIRRFLNGSLNTGSTDEQSKLMHKEGPNIWSWTRN